LYHQPAIDSTKKALFVEIKAMRKRKYKVCLFEIATFNLVSF